MSVHIVRVDREILFQCRLTPEIERAVIIFAGSKGNEAGICMRPESSSRKQVCVLKVKICASSSTGSDWIGGIADDTGSQSFVKEKELKTALYQRSASVNRQGQLGR